MNQYNRPFFRVVRNQLLIWSLFPFFVSLSGCGEKPAKTSATPIVTNDAHRSTGRNSANESDANSEATTESIHSGFDPLPVSSPSTTQPKPESLADLRRQRDDTVWKKETLAQQYEQSIVRLWDQLLNEQHKPSGGDPFSVFANQTLEAIRIGQPGAVEEIGWGVTQQLLNVQPTLLPASEWQSLALSLRDAGYQIEQTEWHHATFDLSEAGIAKSTIRMAIYAVHPDRDERYVLGGDLIIEWQPSRDDQPPVPRTLDATGLRLDKRVGPPAFQEVLTIDHAQPNTRSGIHPVSVHDFDGDGLCEIVLGGSNELLWNRGNARFERDRLLNFPEKGFEVSLIADVSGDGICDYLYPGLRGDLLMYVADADGRFVRPPKGKARGGGPLQQPQVITAGDIDNDGDLDVWIGQYRISYMGGQMPTPYFDANDGFEAYLLVNQGGGNFVPATEEAGLAEKRRRRSYGGSFVDLDSDLDLDLLVVSDFAGIDVYLNDGKGRFEDVTDSIVDERHLFGMSATFADYNLDGQLDFFVSGMASTTARRLEYMKLGRQDRPEVHRMRSRMGYGNRMYLADANGAYAQPSFRDSVSRTGWTWGSTSFDFDNDGNPDIFVANGHSSGKSTKDHCSHFWCHDIYDATSQPDFEVLSVFNESMKGYFDRSESWDGYQKNQLLANRGDTSGFVNIGFLLGVGHEYDGRAVISDDLDGDGRLDLLVVEDRWQEGQVLHVYRNEYESDNDWIGVRLVERPGVNSPIGAKVAMTLADGKQRVASVTTGDSIHAQHATTVHFGLGRNQNVSTIEVRFPSGDTIRLEDPDVNKYHTVHVK